jgi:hypothetical protein
MRSIHYRTELWVQKKGGLRDKNGCARALENAKLRNQVLEFLLFIILQFSRRIFCIILFCSFSFLSSDFKTSSKGKAENIFPFSVSEIIMPLSCRCFRLWQICCLVVFRFLTMLNASSGPFNARKIYTLASFCERPKITRALNMRCRLILLISF